MKTISIKTISIKNFKGIRNIKINFNGKNTIIKGDNATGKTTILDAFTWALFGNDSLDRKDFELKTLDNNNNVIPKIEHSVTVVLLNDGAEIKLKKVLEENWVKQRGTSTPVFKGNKTEHYWNDVPMKKNEYEQKINLIIDETIFKLVSNPMYFNSLHWEKQRALITSIIPTINDYDDVADKNTDFQTLLNSLNGKTLNEKKKEVSQKIKNIKKDLEKIPTRIDEVVTNMPDEIDEIKVKKEIDVLQKELSDIENSIFDKNKIAEKHREKITTHRKKLYDVEDRLESLKRNLSKEISNSKNEKNEKINNLQNDISNAKSDISYIENNIQLKVNSIRTIEEELNNIRVKWVDENEKEFTLNENELICPTCKRELSNADDLKIDLENNFKLSKKQQLENLSEKGKAKKQEKEKLEKVLESERLKLKSIQSSLKEYELKLDDLSNISIDNDRTVSLDEKLSNNKEFTLLNKELERLKENEPEDLIVDTFSLTKRKKEITAKIVELQRKLNINESIVKSKARINELEKEEQKLATLISELEKQEFIIQEFVKKKMSIIESSANKLFKIVKFKLFDTQINGSKVPTCKAIVNGVPYDSLNSAMKINCGIDICNTFAKYNNVLTPIWVDNSESINDIIETESQLIKLEVSRDKKLIIVN